MANINALRMGNIVMVYNDNRCKLAIIKEVLYYEGKLIVHPIFTDGVNGHLTYKINAKDVEKINLIDTFNLYNNHMKR